MKIISKKKWEEFEQKYVELQCDLNKALEDNANYYNQVNLLIKDNKAKDVRIQGLIDYIDNTITKQFTPVKPVKRRTKKVKEVKDGEEKENNTHR